MNTFNCLFRIISTRSASRFPHNIPNRSAPFLWSRNSPSGLRNPYVSLLFKNYSSSLRGSWGHASGNVAFHALAHTYISAHYSFQIWLRYRRTIGADAQPYLQRTRPSTCIAQLLAQLPHPLGHYRTCYECVWNIPPVASFSASICASGYARWTAKSTSWRHKHTFTGFR